MERIRFTVEDADGVEVEHTLPAVWTICRTCRGNGTHAHGIGAITGSEWAEWHEDEREDYLAGRYDRTCEACDGSGKVLTVDEERADAAVLALYEERQADAAAERAREQYERRMGF